MWFSGTLVVKTITGRNGPFNVAKVHLEVGEFAIKHPLIQQLDDGRYPILVDVENIFISTRPANGASISELAVWAKDIQIQSDDAAPSESNDPLMVPGLVEEPEEPAQPVVPAVAAGQEDGIDPNANALADEGTAQAAVQEDSEVIKLFGDLANAVLARQTVKLDPASNQIRAQAAYLRKHGFKYFPVEKVWRPIDPEAA